MSLAHELAIETFEIPIEPSHALMLPEMKAEITECIGLGFNVKIADTEDQTSEADVERMEQMNEVLHLIQNEYDEFESEARANGLGPKELKIELQAFREQLMFGDPINAIPWHYMRGTALALQTIQEASPEMQRMGGSIGEEVLHQTFNGMSLRDKLAEATKAAFKGQIEDSQALAAADQRIASVTEFVNWPTSEPFKDIVRFCADSVGIRSRAEIVKNEVVSHIAELDESGMLPENPKLVSLGCGNGRTILEIGRELVQRGYTPRIELIDQDPMALAFAMQMAENMGLLANVNVHSTAIFSNNEALNISEVLSVDNVADAPLVIEDSGLREYLNDGLNLKLNKACLAALHPDGISVSGNMNKNRFNPNYLHGAMGWTPKVKMRNIVDMIQIYGQAGVKPSDVKAIVTKDGMYTMYVVKKEMVSTTVDNPLALVA